jgi:hypothetical protein
MQLIYIVTPTLHASGAGTRLLLLLLCYYRCTEVGILHSTGQAVALHCTIAKGSSGGIRFCIESEIEGSDSSRGKGSRVREDNEAAAWQKVMLNIIVF